MKFIDTKRSQSVGHWTLHKKKNDRLTIEVKHITVNLTEGERMIDERKWLKSSSFLCQDKVLIAR